MPTCRFYCTSIRYQFQVTIRDVAGESGLTSMQTNRKQCFQFNYARGKRLVVSRMIQTNNPAASYGVLVEGTI